VQDRTIAAMGEQVAGTLTFVFTDIEGSTRRWQRHGDAMRDALERHDSMAADVIEGAGGRIFKHTGDGVCAVFGSSGAAVEAAVELQRRLVAAAAAGEWDAVDGLAVRIGVHTGEATTRDGDYFGPALNRVARIMAVAHGGQILLSNATAALVGPAVGDVTIVDLGEHALRDLDVPERLHQANAPGLPTDFPPARVAPRRGGGASRLPVARTAFVGRRADIVAVAALVTDDADPLVTLVGIGGTGKTRLAVEVAESVRDRYDGVAFVDLAPLTDGGQIPTAMAAALGISVGGGPGAGAVLDAVVAGLAVRSHLVVLDNCEHLVDDCAELVDMLLDACPDVTVLATSREALAVEGERTWPVGSLPADDAVALFVDRALAADARVDITSPGARATVEEICRRLDGIPLAIELAASRVAHLSPEEVAARLDDRFRLLTGGRQRRAQRQQTLQATIDWSHDLLDGGERALLRRASVFAGGFTLEAAERVCVEDDIDVRRVVDLLGALVAKSLVIADRSTASTRYRMLETIRLYAADRLVEAGEAERIRDAHAAWWREWVERFPADERCVRLDTVLALEAELDNLRAAIDWWQTSERVELAADLTASIAGVWSLGGYHEEGWRRLRELCDGDGLADDVRARCLAALAFISMVIGDFALMHDSAMRSIEIDPGGAYAPMAWSHAGLALVFDPGRYAEAHNRFDEARRAATARDHSAFREGADGVEAHFFVVEGRFDLALSLGPPPPARDSWAELNLRLAHHAAHLLRGEPECALDAIEWLAAAWPEWIQAQRALALLDLGDRGGARAATLAGARLFLEQPYPLLVADTLVAFAALALHDGDAARCVSILAATTAERGLASFRSPSIAMLSRRYLDRARDRLTPEDYTAARAAGRVAGSLATFHAELERLENEAMEVSA
jgi:predicted ATPase/class 3 adenylate cyclase